MASASVTTPTFAAIVKIGLPPQTAFMGSSGILEVGISSCATTISKNSRTKSKLFKLPVEIRLQIYKYAIEDSYSIAISFYEYIEPALMRTNYKIRGEVLSVFPDKVLSRIAEVDVYIEEAEQYLTVVHGEIARTQPSVTRWGKEEEYSKLNAARGSVRFWCLMRQDLMEEKYSASEEMWWRDEWPVVGKQE